MSVVLVAISILLMKMNGCPFFVLHRKHNGFMYKVKLSSARRFSSCMNGKSFLYKEMLLLREEEHILHAREDPSLAN